MDRQTIDHVARLARLGVMDADRTRYEGQLAAILGHFEALQRLDTDSVDPSSAPAATSGRTRADLPRGDQDGVDIVTLAADREDRSFRVPRVLE